MPIYTIAEKRFAGIIEVVTAAQVQIETLV
jgi:hypothetical protein